MQSSLPTEAIRRWVAEAIGGNDPIARMERLSGGMSTTILALTSRRGREFVLRLYDNEKWLHEEPDLPQHEAKALALAGAIPVPTPELIAVEETGEFCGMPLLLMSRLPGEVRLPQAPSERWLDWMAEALASVHEFDPGELGEEVFPWRYYAYVNVKGLADLQWGWTSERERWNRVIEIVQQPEPSASPRFIHRDFHPTNILWTEARLTGVVDWVNACRGPAGIDVGHCRLNLALMYGVEAADRFLLAYETSAGHRFSYHPYWDFRALIEVLPGPVEVYPGWPACGLSGLTSKLVTERYGRYMSSLLERV